MADGETSKSNMPCLENESELLSSINSGDLDLDAKIKQWLCWDKNPDTRNEVKTLLLKKDFKGLAIRFKTRMEFGTAGLRSVFGAGFARMNDLTIIQTCQGLCTYLHTQFPDLKERGIVIGHDARYGSHKFARLCATAFLSHNIKVYLFSDIVPTPFVPYSVKRYSCAAGVMVTASHNPKEDNGYKVYYSNGAQIISPHDQGISKYIMENLEPWESAWNADMYKQSQLYVDPLKDVLASYLKDIESHCHFRENNKNSKLTITYTAMHGVGQRYAEEAFKAFSLNPFVTVKEQAQPDPDFPTVKFPNPEEGKSALDLSIKTANENNSRVIIANDPDADRLAVAEKQQSESWKIFTGNELGALLGWWSYINHRRLNPEQPGKNIYMVHSTVSSKVLQSIADVEGFCVEETLTGFKWMANKAIELMEKGNTVLFAFEEAIGFMYGAQVLDKDGICAAAVISEMASHLYAKGTTLTGQLEQIYKKYGIHVSNNSYFICHSQPTMKRIFDRIRTMGNGTYPNKVGEFKIIGIRDLTGEGFDSHQPDNKPILPTSSSSQMLTFTFDNGCIATIRTSGTEPKVKYYAELTGKPGQSMDATAAKAELDRLVACMINELLEPEKNGLAPRSE